MLAPAGPAVLAGARRGLLAALAAGLACYAVLLGIAAAHRQAPPRNVGLTAWLTRHHLTSGFAPYWEASSITVDSGGAITLLAVTDSGWHGHLAPQKWVTDTLLTKKMPPASFVILSPAEKVRRSSVLATFGQPAQELPRTAPSRSWSGTRTWCRRCCGRTSRPPREPSASSGPARPSESRGAAGPHGFHGPARVLRARSPARIAMIAPSTPSWIAMSATSIDPPLPPK